MASWEQKTLAESGIVDNITNTAAAAAETVTDLATQVQDIAEGAKVLLVHLLTLSVQQSEQLHNHS